MRSTFSILPYINRNKVKADGTTAVLCRITIDGKSSTMATGIYCRPEDWNSKTGAIRTVRENNRLQEFRKSVELAYDEILKKQNVVSAELLKNTLAKRAVIPTKLLQMGERERERLLARSKEINSTSTYRHSGYYQKYLKEYLTSLGKEDIEFTDITEDFGSSYKAFMKRNKNFSAQQINKCLCWLSKLVYLAVDYEILRANPLEDMEYEKKPAPKHRHISRAELKTILETPMLDPLQELGRRAFLFSTFTGIAFSDIRNLTQKNLLKAEDGIWWIHSARRKTGTPFHIPLLDLPLELIAKYRGIAPNGRLFPMLSCSKTNINLKKIASICGIERRVTFHLARHTYASVITLSQGVPLDTVRELMGHRDWRATQIYAHLTNDKVSEDMGRLQERIGNKFELTDNKMAEVVISTPQIKRTKRMKP